MTYWGLSMLVISTETGNEDVESVIKEEEAETDRLEGKHADGEERKVG